MSLMHVSIAPCPFVSFVYLSKLTTDQIVLKFKVRYVRTFCYQVGDCSSRSVGAGGRKGVRAKVDGEWWLVHCRPKHI